MPNPANQSDRLTRGCCKLALGLILLFAASVAAAAEIDFDDAIGFETTECWIKLYDKAKTECGWLTVAEDWKRPQGKKLQLPVVIYHALYPDPSLDPIIFLSGGPGVPALGQGGKNIPGWRQTVDQDFPGRTVVLFDQRGSGFGSTKLDCHEYDDPLRWNVVSTDPDHFGEWAGPPSATCLERHRAAGRPLEVFNSFQNATDVEALRRALRLDKVVLFGISYGTRLSLTVMRHYPEQISAAILDSVIPPEATFSGFDGAGTGVVLDRMFLACEQKPDCADKFPDLRAQLITVLEQLQSEPLVIEIFNSKGSEPLYLRIDQNMFLAILRKELYSILRYPRLPLLIAGMTRGEYWRLPAHAENLVYSTFPDNTDMGASTLIMCADENTPGVRLKRQTADKLDAFLQDFEQWNLGGWPCRDLPVNPDPSHRDPVVSDIPTLLLAGGLDVSTPVEQAEMAAASLSRGYLVVFPANAHDQVWGNSCAWTLITEFLATPEKRPEPECLESLRQPTFHLYG
ncbi:MAG: alpha/beta hydrolase [Gammaproteobacteria bacterium]|nr:alpha/beta hydrolase [Gammaproteobacteria bacterium]